MEKPVGKLWGVPIKLKVYHKIGWETVHFIIKIFYAKQESRSSKKRKMYKRATHCPVIFVNAVKPFLNWVAIHQWR
jgi:hypothetical protein